MSWVGEFLRHPITVGAYYFTVIIVAIIYDRLMGQESPYAVALTAIAVGVAFLVAIFISSQFFRVGQQRTLNDRILDLQEFINAQHMGWIVNDKYIRALEVGSPVTWVFTRNLVNDLSVDGEIYQAVKSNLSNGNRYVYFIPDVPSAYDIIDRYRKIHDYRPGQVAFHLIPESSFCFYTEVVVYNVDNAERIAIEWLPQASLNYFIAMDQAHTDHVSGIGKMFISKFPAFEIARA